MPELLEQVSRGLSSVFAQAKSSPGAGSAKTGRREGGPAAGASSRSATPPPFTKPQISLLEDGIMGAMRGFNEAVNARMVRHEERLDGVDTRVAAVEVQQNQQYTRVSKLEDEMGKVAAKSQQLDGSLATVRGENVRCDKRLCESESEIKALREQMRVLQDKLKNAGGAPLPDGLVKRVEALEKSSESDRSSVAGSSAASVRSQPSDPNRLVCVMGGLGYDSSEKVVTERCIECLKACGVADSAYHSVCALFKPGGTGSIAQLVFVDRAELDSSVLRVRAARRSYEESITNRNGHVWLSVKLSEAERRPTRQVKRVAAVMKEILGTKQPPLDPAQLTADIRTRSISYAALKIGWIDRNQDFRWTSMASDYFTGDEQNMIDAACDGVR